MWTIAGRSVIGLLVIQACTSPSEPQMPFERVAVVMFSSFPAPAFEVVRDAQTWEQVWRRTGRSEPARAIDFGEFMVIVAAAGPKPSGYTIEIEQLLVVGGGLRAAVRLIAPGQGCRVPDEGSSPMDAVLVRRMAGEVQFSVADTVRNCA